MFWYTEEMERLPENHSELSFDLKNEKRRRREIRKELEQVISVPLKAEGFKREGVSKWVRKIGGTSQLLYLQRSTNSHSYYIEVGICEDTDIPKGEKADIVYCSEDNRQRLERVVSIFYNQQHSSEADVEEKTKEAAQNVRDALSFDITDGLEKYPGEYYFPSVSQDEAKEKIEAVGKFIEEYIPEWFSKQN